MGFLRDIDDFHDLMNRREKMEERSSVELNIHRQIQKKAMTLSRKLKIFQMVSWSSLVESVFGSRLVLLPMSSMSRLIEAPSDPGRAPSKLSERRKGTGKMVVARRRENNEGRGGKKDE
jgi:hypothetical protein